MGNRIVTKEQRAEVAKVLGVDISQVDLTINDEPVRTVMMPVSTWRNYGEVEARSTLMSGLNYIEVTAGTDGVKERRDGKDEAGTCFILEDGGCTNWSVMVKDDGGNVATYNPESITINLIGASEANSFADAIEFAAKTLRHQLQNNKTKS